MRFIPTRVHAPLDYIVGAVLIALPWIFGFSEETTPTVISIVLGVGLIAYSLLTDYELGVWRIAPMSVHNLIDIVAGAFLAASPWIFGYADDDEEMVTRRLRQANLMGPAGLVSVDDSEVLALAQAGCTGGGGDGSSFVEMGGRGTEGVPHMVTEVALRAFYRCYREAMGL